MNVHWCRNSDRFLTIFPFGTWMARYLPPANEVFTPVCQSFCSQGGGVSASLLARIHLPPDQRQVPPQTRCRYPPPRPEASTLPGTRGRYPPIPEAGTPPAQCMLGDTGNKRAVRILLECNLVVEKYLLNVFIVHWVSIKSEEYECRRILCLEFEFECYSNETWISYISVF